MNSIIKCENIIKSYKMGQTRLQVLKGVNLETARGEFVAVMGSSGSGKSTLLHILGALDKPDSGEIIYEGTNLARISAARLNAYRNKQVGFVFQFYHLLDEFNVLENTLLPAMASSSVIKWAAISSDIKKRAVSLLEKVGLADRLNHKPHQLSGGERQRTALARALINEPRLLLADEPTGNLDWQRGSEILTLLKQLNKEGQTIIMVTHDKKVADAADRTVVIQDGKI
ncbi:Lipoprotein-releasing system ATP-binding protein LolD [Limihaloglobus sulfuriphilus]|uniref:Lipoprotein-releasing system ATP-binding protein LolD n=1 Tax=Limihaloglobus sulfuriphilus TaxID=1851148 RepID=A0A1Q2MC89_9BACT|nr:ABC transporter ATP-binding protein [Limihaloglobus sulfuriphilus]AQQ70280.1 Lipoprotein-releasing system ATP-binding protein LolD [Limihaloglobus sulfuriphilus]